MQLPNEILVHILQYVTSHNDVYNCMRVNRLFYKYVYRDDMFQIITPLIAEATLPVRALICIIAYLSPKRIHKLSQVNKLFRILADNNITYVRSTIYFAARWNFPQEIVTINV